MKYQIRYEPSETNDDFDYSVYDTNGVYVRAFRSYEDALRWTEAH